MRVQYLFAGAVVLIVALFLLSSNSSSTGTATPASDITIANANDNKRPVSLSKLKGKVVLIDFWATWCGPCRMSIPGIQRLYEKNRDRGFEVIGVALENDEGQSLPGFLREMKMTYPAGMPTDINQVRPYTSGSIPQMALVDRKGNIVWQQTGYSPATDAELEEQVETLLKQK